MSDQLKDPHEIKAAIVEQYHANSRRMGLEVSGSDLERIAAADLQAVARYEAAQKAAPHPAAKPEPVERVNKGAEFAAARGAKLEKNFIAPAKTAPLRDLIMSAKPKTMNPKFDAMMARAFRVMQPNEVAAGRGIDAMAGTSDTPLLAKKMLAEFMNYKLWHLAPGKNPYHVTGAKDRARIFIRRVEDLCDQSTAHYGPWWVK